MLFCGRSPSPFWTFTAKAELPATSSLTYSTTIRFPVTLLGSGETLTQFSPCRSQLYTRAAPTSSLRPLRWKTWFVLSIATALPAGSNAKKYAVESNRFGPVRFQIPVNVETGLTRSSEPVPKKTPPAENEARAVKETGPASILKIHDPSIGDAMPHILL